MDDPLQARAYAEADFAGSDQAFSDRILALLSREAPAGDGHRVVDLGCGPGNISFRLASALPKASVLGLDGAAAMLELAQKDREREPGRWPRLHFHQARLPLKPSELAALPPAHRPPYSLIVSNSLLHHLHEPAVLWQTVRELAAPAALVVMRDLRRPASLEAIAELVDRHAASAPAVLRRDFAHSLAAAFLPEEVERQLAAAGLSQWRVEPVEDRYLEIWGGSGPTTSMAVRCTTKRK